MKKSLLLAGISAFVLLASCKNDKKIEDKIDLKKYKISFDLITEKPDSLQLFYSNDSVQSFVPEQSIWALTEGDSLNQIVSFELPDKFVPTYIRLDFTNKEQNNITLNNIKIEYNSKVYLAQDSIFDHFFSGYGVVFQDSIHQINIIKDQKTFDPFIYSTDYLKAKMDNLSK